MSNSGSHVNYTHLAPSAQKDRYEEEPARSHCKRHSHIAAKLRPHRRAEQRLTECDQPHAAHATRAIPRGGLDDLGR